MKFNDDENMPTTRYLRMSAMMYWITYHRSFWIRPCCARCRCLISDCCS